MLCVCLWVRRGANNQLHPLPLQAVLPSKRNGTNHTNHPPPITAQRQGHTSPHEAGSAKHKSATHP